MARLIRGSECDHPRYAGGDVRKESRRVGVELLEAEAVKFETGGEEIRAN